MDEIRAKPPVIISGMAGSSIGWQEIPYAGLPFPLDGSRARCDEVEPGIWIIGGVRSERDVMRGEETELLGMEGLPDDVLVILPGTHSKHCRIAKGKLAGFDTYMTGEVFAVLRTHSVLRKSIGPGWDEESFARGARAGATRPLLSELFQVRARDLLEGVSPAAGFSFLSGLLIGSELASVAMSVPLVILAPEEVRGHYLAAADAIGIGSRVSAAEIPDDSSLAVRGHMKLIPYVL
jgi:2-dehydro-3-deoxygalactonokinase